MPEALAQCSWPSLPERYAEALRAAVAFIFDEVDAVGIVATGTIVRGAFHASSDLDLYVVHDAPFRRRVQRYFGDRVPAEIIINPPDAVRRYFAEEHASGRSITAHMLATGHVVFARDSTLEELRCEAASWLERPSYPSPAAVVRSRYAAASHFEDAIDVADADPFTASMIMARAVTAMLELWCQTRTGAVPRAKDLIARVAELDPALGMLARRVFSDAAFAERLRAAGDIADRTIDARGFFEWDSGPDPVPMP